LFSPLDETKLGRLLQENTVRDAGLEGRPRRAAAFLLLFERNETRALFIRKKVSPGYPWSGQIGMPGGFVEESDADDVAAAYRELEEELQIPAVDVRFLGELGYFPTQITVVSLRVFVGIWNGEGTPRPDPAEIDRLVEVGVEDLLAVHKGNGYAGRSVDSIAVRELIYPTDAGDIWGVTGRVLFAFNEMVRAGRQS